MCIFTYYKNNDEIIVEYEGNIAMICKNSVKIIYNTTPRDTSFLPFFMMSYVYFVNANMYFDLFGVILNILVSRHFPKS